MIPIYDDNPTERPPVVTLSLILACVLVFLWQLSLGDALERYVYALGVVPAVLTGQRELAPEIALVSPPLTLFSSMFLHGGWMHLIGNMIYLWIFGNNVEDAMGHGRFLVFYGVCGVAAALTQTLPASDSLVPMIGASGAISGVLGAYLLLYPHARVLVVVPIGFYLHTMALKAGWVLAFWFLLQLVNSAVTEAQEGGVAWGAHIGGFVAGLLLVSVFKRRGVPLFQPQRTDGTSRQ
jgi:membrane associated rhomboid family serine protease